MALPRTTVNHTLIDPTADPIQRAGTIVLGGFVGRQWRDIQGMSTDGQIISAIQVDADINGDWSVALIANTDVANPANTLYRYLPAAGDPVVFEVKTGGPFQLADLVITDPAQWPGLVPTTIGPTGPANTLHEGTATTGAPGTNMSFSITGTPPNQTLSLTIPRGDKGDAATVGVDPTVTGEPGSSAAVSNTGDTHNAVFEFTVPRGSIIHSGSGAPAAGLGGENDFYFRTNGLMYGPKTSGSWGSGVSLIGPQGDGLEYDWSGTQLGVRVEGDPSYSYVDLVGQTGPQGVVWKGDWVSGSAYVVGDGVSRNGSSYIAIQDGTNKDPATEAAYWDLLARAGVDGLGSVVSVNSVGPDGSGDVVLAPGDIGAADASHTHTATQISDSTAVGRDVLTAANAAAARAAIGAGTSSLIIGTTAGTAMEGDKTFATTVQGAKADTALQPTDFGTDAGEVAEGNDSRFVGVPVSTKTADYTLVAGDAGSIVEMNKATALTLTVPNSVFSAGQIVEICQIGAGQVTLAPASGVTLRSADGLKISDQYGSASIRFRSASEAVVAGALAT